MCKLYSTLQLSLYPPGGTRYLSVALRTPTAKELPTPIGLLYAYSQPNNEYQIYDGRWTGWVQAHTQVPWCISCIASNQPLITYSNAAVAIGEGERSS